MCTQHECNWYGRDAQQTRTQTQAKSINNKDHLYKHDSRIIGFSLLPPCVAHRISMVRFEEIRALVYPSQTKLVLQNDFVSMII